MYAKTRTKCHQVLANGFSGGSAKELDEIFPLH